VAVLDTTASYDIQMILNLELEQHLRRRHICRCTYCTAQCRQCYELRTEICTCIVHSRSDWHLIVALRNVGKRGRLALRASRCNMLLQPPLYLGETAKRDTVPMPPQFVRLPSAFLSRALSMRRGRAIDARRLGAANCRKRPAADAEIAQSARRRSW
jgi:hypothetical protein